MLLAVEMPSSISNIYNTRQGTYLPALFSFDSCSWGLPCEHGAGHAHLGGIRHICASSLASDTACVRVVKRADK